MGGRRGKAVFTTVKHITLSKERTRRGNPTFYHYSLACGHADRRSHSPNVSVQTFMYFQGLAFRVRCRECENKS